MTKARLPQPRRSSGSRILLPVFAAAAFGLCGCGSGDEGEAASGGPSGRPGGPPGGFGGARSGAGSSSGTAVPVEVVEILPGEIAAFIETNGTLEAEREVDIVARIGGPLTDLRTEEGMQVSSGQLLAQVDEAEPRAQVEIAQVSLQQAERALERARASFENSVVSQEVYDTAVSTFESARAQLDGSRIQFGYTRVEAPFDGLIIERVVKFGETVTPGQRLFRISDFDPLLCTIGVPERDLTRLSVGQPARIEVEAFPEESFQGRVLRVSPVVDASTGTIRVTLEVDRQGRLSPGMFATVRLVTDVRENALILPKRALSLESLADSVFVVEDGVAYRRNITLGYEEEERVEVTSGLQTNDRVIVVGQDGLTDATPVQILAGPGAETTAPRRAADGTADGTDERRERMRARGMTDAQIDERLAAMAAGGTPREGRPESPATGEAGGAARGTPPRSRASGSAPPPPASPAPAADTAAADDGVAAPAPRQAGGAEKPQPPSFEAMSPEVQEAIRTRLRMMGMTEEQIEERLRTGWNSDPAASRAEPADGTRRNAMTAEEIETFRERLRERGLTEEQIEERLRARRRPRR